MNKMKILKTKGFKKTKAGLSQELKAQIILLQDCSKKKMHTLKNIFSTQANPGICIKVQWNSLKVF